MAVYSNYPKSHSQMVVYSKYPSTPSQGIFCWPRNHSDPGRKLYSLAPDSWDTSPSYIKGMNKTRCARMESGLKYLFSQGLRLALQELSASPRRRVYG